MKYYFGFLTFLALINGILSNPCQNGGKLKDGVCNCPVANENHSTGGDRDAEFLGYEGTSCQTAFVQCKSSNNEKSWRCKNHATCGSLESNVNDTDNYCICSEAYTGTYCETYDPMSVSNPEGNCPSLTCYNGGKCKNSTGKGLYCDCPKGKHHGYEGKYCEDRYHDCQRGYYIEYKCFNYATCNQFTWCACRNSNFKGRYCNQEVVPTQSPTPGPDEHIFLPKVFSIKNKSCKKAQKHCSGSCTYRKGKQRGCRIDSKKQCKCQCSGLILHKDISPGCKKRAKKFKKKENRICDPANTIDFKEMSSKNGCKELCHFTRGCSSYQVGEGKCLLFQGDAKSIKKVSKSDFKYYKCNLLVSDGIYNEEKKTICDPSNMIEFIDRETEISCSIQCNESKNCESFQWIENNDKCFLFEGKKVLKKEQSFDDYDCYVSD